MADSNVEGQVHQRWQDLLMTSVAQDSNIVPLQLESLISPLTETLRTVQNLGLYL